MGIFGTKKKDINQALDISDFYIGVEDTFRLKDSVDLVIVGKVHGIVTAGAAIYIANPGEDDAPIVLTTVEGIEINHTIVHSATDTLVGLRIARGSELNIKIGSVLFTRNVSTKDIHDAYIQALGDAYISFRQMKLEENDYANMSLTDLAELRRLYRWLIEQKKEQETEEIKAFNKNVLDTIAHHMCEKILESKEIYVVMHKKTGEPFMMSRVIQRQDGYLTTPPDIMIITKAYLEVMKNAYNPEVYDIVRIDNGEDKKGIYNFLGSTFYLNGACGVKVIYDSFSIDASMLVEKPDYGNVPKIQIPVTNPDVERWLLLLGQMGEAMTEDEKLICRIFDGHLLRELEDARFIIPMKMDAQMDPPDAEGKTVIKENSTIAFATMSGKNDRDAVMMYTDWKRLRMVYKEEDGWSGLIQPISDMIDKFDCAINSTEYIAAGCYIDKNAYETDIKKN